MKKVTVHAWVQDNNGSYHKPGSTLIVDDDGADGCITAKAASALVDSRNALPHSAQPEGKPARTR